MGPIIFLGTLEEDITFPNPKKVYEFHNDVIVFLIRVAMLQPSRDVANEYQMLKIEIFNYEWPMYLLQG
jgi:hypothetical protein